jgi:hypothetical protein
MGQPHFWPTCVGLTHTEYHNWLTTPHRCGILSEISSFAWGGYSSYAYAISIGRHRSGRFRLIPLSQRICRPDRTVEYSRPEVYVCRG